MLADARLGGAADVRPDVGREARGPRATTRAPRPACERTRAASTSGEMRSRPEGWRVMVVAGRPDLCIPGADGTLAAVSSADTGLSPPVTCANHPEGRDRRPLLELRQADLSRLHGAGAGRDQVPRLRAHAPLGPRHAAAAEGGQGGRRRVRRRLGVRRAARLRRRRRASGSSRSSSRTSSGCSRAARRCAPPGTTGPRRRPGSPQAEPAGRTSAPGSSSPRRSAATPARTSR